MLRRARLVSAAFGVLAVALLAWIDPLAGLLLGIHTFAVEYTSVAYLEAVPAFLSLLAVRAYDCWAKLSSEDHRINRNWLCGSSSWLALSATMLGIALASKYMYGLVAIAIAIHWLRNLRLRHNGLKNIGLLTGWGAITAFVFISANPHLWIHTIARLKSSLLFQVHYAASNYVQGYGYPFFQPLLWLLHSVSHQPHKAIPYLPGSFLIQLDLPIALLALIGIPRLFKHQALYAIWLIAGLLFLFGWSTKWPQYVMLILVPWCMSAAAGVRTLISLFDIQAGLTHTSSSSHYPVRRSQLLFSGR